MIILSLVLRVQLDRVGLTQLNIETYLNNHFLILELDLG